jgi:hypothetical protein
MIGTLSELKTAIAAWTVRSDMESRMSDIVQLSEAEIRKDVRCQAMEAYTSGTLTGETLAFPTGFIWAKRLKVGRYVQQYVTPAEYADLDEIGGQNEVFTIIGQDIYILNGVTDDPYTLIYHKAFTTLSDEADTNWLLTNHPDVYLFAGCAKVALVTKDDKALARFTALYQKAVNAVNRIDWLASASGAPIRVRTNVCTP